MSDIIFPPRIMVRFVEILSAELGHDTFTAVLEKAGLPADWADASHFNALDATRSAEAYSNLQNALRTYYGRGARSILTRIGARLWGRLLDDAAFGVKAQAAFVRGLPTGMRRKPALELLARLLGAAQGEITIHTLDLDLLFVDHTSPTTLNRSDAAPLCFVTLGLIRECLFWATGFEHDIEESSCRAAGAKECEFKITTGGNNENL
jgi:predicted hydrocarbon binding protein